MLLCKCCQEIVGVCHRYYLKIDDSAVCEACQQKYQFRYWSCSKCQEKTLSPEELCIYCERKQIQATIAALKETKIFVNDLLPLIAGLTVSAPRLQLWQVSGMALPPPA
jgi:hypothetical protein